MIVVKIGGNALAKKSDLSWIQVMADLTLAGEKFVLVHGGGPQIDSELELHGISRRFVEGLRYTDKETYEVVEMVLAGTVQQQLVRTLKTFGLSAVGISGNDGGLVTAAKRESMSGEDLGFVIGAACFVSGASHEELARGTPLEIQIWECGTVCRAVDGALRERDEGAT